MSFVGATKVARNLPLSGRPVEWHSPIPAPSLRELSSESETEGVSSDGSTGPMVCEPDRIGSEIFERLHSSKYTLHNINHPPAGYCVSGRVIFVGSAWGYILPFNRVLANIRGCGRFSSPLRSSECFGFYHSSGDTPSVTPVGRDSSLREGAGNGLCHSSGYSLKSYVTGDFHRPYENSECLTVPFQRRTLPSAVGRGEFWGVSSLRRCGRGTSPGCPCRRRRR